MNLLNTWWWLLPLASGLMLALVSGPLGSFVVWRRMAFFGDTLAHGALLGITLGVISDLNPTLALLLSSIALGLLLYPLQQGSSLSSDTLLGIISHSMLAFGLVALSLARNVRVDLMGYLFGDLLAVGLQDLLWITMAALLCGVLLIWQWRGLLATTVSQELASIDGYPVARLNLLLILMLALIIALAMKIVGVLLISALLIIPPATARSLARTPERMALTASVVGMLSVSLGLMASWQWDTPAGPSVVVVAALLFVASLTIRKRG